MSETVLLVGGGGREHALARAIADSDVDHRLIAAADNRNPGIATLADEYKPVSGTDVDAVTDLTERVAATIAVIGPEAPLEAGLSDALEEVGCYPFAPTRADARIETDKAWQREFMARHDIPGCPSFATFDDPEAAIAHVDSVEGDVALKPRGLTGGKGVRVTGDQLAKSQAPAYIRDSGYESWVIEERLIGEEFTIQAFVADGELRPTPAVQDHKRAYEGDEGPNTGGMGSYSGSDRTLPFMTAAEYDAAVEVMAATVDALETYRGVLYGQFMLTADGPKVVEFNARLGDPEAMNMLPVLETDFLEIVIAAREGRSLPEPSFADRATVCKYAVPEGYPTDPDGGTRISIDESTVEDVNREARRAGSATTEPPTVHLFYASVDAREDGIYTTTSRSFAVVGEADDIGGAEVVAAAALGAAGDGVRIRHDIGTAELIERRVEHMRRLRG